MNCTIEQEFGLTVWLNIKEGEFITDMVQFIPDYIFIFELHKFNNLRIPGHPARSNRTTEVKPL